MDSKAEIPTPTDHASSKEFPTDPEKRFEAIFAAIGNSEAKCLTLLCLSESPVSPRDLYHQFTTQNNGSWEPNKSTPAEYCEQTLVPIGLVAYADVIRQGTLEHTTGYRLTVAEKKFQPISAFLTEKSCGLPYSLIEIFGATHTRGKSRSAINRSRIMEFLSSNPNAKVIDIAKSIGISPGLVGNHLRHLSKLGILEFSSINAENPGSVGYVVNKDINVDEIKSKKKLGLLSSRVIDFLMDKDSFTLEEAARAIHNYYPDVEFNSFRGKLSKTMVSLEKDGIFHRSTFSSKLRSRASLTEIGNKIVNEIVSPIKEVLSGNEDLLAQWSRIDWRKFAPLAVERYREVKPHQNQRTKEGKATVLGIITENPGIRRLEIRKTLGKHPNQFLIDLLKEKRIIKEKKGRAACYYPTASVSYTDSQTVS